MKGFNKPHSILRGGREGGIEEREGEIGIPGSRKYRCNREMCRMEVFGVGDGL